MSDPSGSPLSSSSLNPSPAPTTAALSPEPIAAADSIATPALHPGEASLSDTTTPAVEAPAPPPAPVSPPHSIFSPPPATSPPPPPTSPHSHSSLASRRVRIYHLRSDG